MAKKPKFQPQIVRVKLNPEQAVLSCNCYNVSRAAMGGPGEVRTQGCFVQMSPLIPGGVSRVLWSSVCRAESNVSSS